MSLEDLEKEIKKLNQEISELKQSNEELKINLRKYTCSATFMRYYERNKEKIQKQQKEYRDRIKLEKMEKLKNENEPVSFENEN
jgi:hypothetical protein